MKSLIWEGKMMKKNLLVVMAVLAMVSLANAALVVGQDLTTKRNWRTVGGYGTEGYVVYGIDRADGNWSGNGGYDATSVLTAAADSQVVLPSYINDISIAPDSYGLWSGDGNFGYIEDPANGNVLTATPVIAWGPDYIITIKRATSDAFRMTLMLSSKTTKTWTNTVDDGAGAVTDILTSANTPSTNYQIFDIAAGTGDVVITIHKSHGEAAFTGIAFDAVPEPATMVLLGLGSVLTLRRRR